MKRPVPGAVEDLVVQVLETTYYNDAPSSRFMGANAANRHRAPVLRVYGVTPQGSSALLHIHGVRPYFYVNLHDAQLKPQELLQFKDYLNSHEALKRSAKDYAVGDQPILEVTQTQKKNIYGYQFNKLSNFLKIYTAVPNLVPSCRKLFEDGVTIPSLGSSRVSLTTFESNVPFALRYMIDSKICGGSWIRLKKNTFEIRHEKKKSSYCQLEVDVNHENIEVFSSEGEWSSIAPIRILSFDIECASMDNQFPDPSSDPVIQIANIVKTQNDEEPAVRNVFTLNSCAPIAGVDVRSFETESEMLLAWRDFVVEIDPDILTGYNIINFDLPYLINRSKSLNVNAKFQQLGRKIGEMASMKDSRFSSRAYGTHESKDIHIEGRIQFDIFPIIQREYKLRSYSLNNVSAHFLKQQKEDVHYSIISDLQNGTPETRRRLAIYCLKDALLPVKLMEKLMILINYIEMARVTGVPVSYLLTRGQQIKVLSQLYRHANPQGFVIPSMKGQGNEETYEGATVFEPVRGYYQTPVATLDFSSLYPSIMMAHNLCYTTFVDRQFVKELDSSQYVITPTGDCFVKPETQPGILPAILEDLLKARKRAKSDMKKETDPLRLAVLNGRQLALKISANSVYGFTGATVGQLPCLAISSSVTGFGRVMIEQTKEIVENHYNVNNGYSVDAKVIYGDTDSVMINFGIDKIEEVFELGKEAAGVVTKHFKEPIKLEFEKVYYPYLLMNKKRYAGLYWTEPTNWSKMDAKGIETVRRDNCSLVKTVVETCLDKILIQRSVDDAIDYVKGVISDLLCSRIDMSQLVITKALGKSTDKEKEGYTAKAAHVELAKRMQKRDPGTAPHIGDRVAYVITKGTKGSAAWERAEDPTFVLDHGLPIDTAYYLENQLKQPLTRLFEPILGDAQKIFEGEHTRAIKVESSNLGIMKFAVKKQKCIGCKVPLSGNDKSSIVCLHCKDKLGELYLEQLGQQRAAEDLYNKLWSECQRCQESLHEDVLCSNRDCPIFYRRKKAFKDLQESQEKLSKFEMEDLY